MPILHKDMTLCISLAGRPSNLGTRFHNRLYDELGLPFVYKAFTTDDVAGALAGVRALGIRGCSVSMPFKEAVIPLVDELEESAAVIGSVNTIVNDGGRLIASNTDQEAVAQLIAPLDASLPVVVRGSGGMAKAVVAAFRGAGFEDVVVLARNGGAGPALADRYGYRWAGSPGAPAEGAVLVNATPLGMTGADADALAFELPHVRAASTVLDVVAVPEVTPLLRAAREAGVPVLTGTQVAALQAARQFERYTGTALTPEQVEAAAAFSRQPA